MTTLASETDLLRCFRDIDRGEVELSPDVRFPVRLDDGAYAWASGPRAFLVYSDGDKPRGLVFHRNAGQSPDVAAMCEWCHAVRTNGRVKLLSVQSGDRRRVGLYLCSDLACVARAHEVPGPDDLTDRHPAEERARRTLERIRDFARRRLF